MAKRRAGGRGRDRRGAQKAKRQDRERTKAEIKSMQIVEIKERDNKGGKPEGSKRERHLLSATGE